MKYSSTSSIFLVQMQLLFTIIIICGTSVNANKKKVVVQMPKKQKQVHHHHHYIVMNPLHGGPPNIGRYDHQHLQKFHPYLGGASNNNFRTIIPLPELNYLSHDEMPTHLSPQNSETHSDYVDHQSPSPLHFHGSNNNYKNIDSISSSYANPEHYHHKIIRKMPGKMDTIPHDDFYHDELPHMYPSYSHHHPVAIHGSKRFPLDFLHHPHPHNSNFDKKHSNVHHVFTSELQQTDY